MRLEEVHPYHVSARNVAISAVGYSAYAIFWRWMFLRFPPRRNKDAKKTSDEVFAKDASLCMVAITSHAFMGPWALCMAVVFTLYGSTADGLSGYLSGVDAFWMRMDLYCCVCGEIITGNFLFQLVFWFLRWETGLVSFLHHLGFVVAGVLVLWVQLYPRLSAAAISMEVSSPFLSSHLLFRQLEGDLAASISNASSVVFVLLFFVVRILFYGYTVLDFQYQYFLHRDGFPPWADPTVTTAIMIIFSVGWVLQLFWSRAVFAKAIKALRGSQGKEKPS